MLVVVVSVKAVDKVVVAIPEGVPPKFAVPLTVKPPLKSPATE